MKRILEHPAEKPGGRKYWRSLDELSDTPEFRNWLEREFPAGADQLNGDEWSRRSFLKLMGASFALAGLTSCGWPRRPEMHLVPFTKSVEWTIPGKALYYASAMPRRTGALPVVVTTVDGRPIKIEGNPLHPASGGGTDAFAQASVLDLYDPARSKRFLEKGQQRDRDAFDKYLKEELLPKIGADGGASLAFLVEQTYSPTRERLRGELEKRYPKMRWCMYEPVMSEAQTFATDIAFGQNTKLLPQFDRADIVLAIDSDFLDCGEGDVQSTKAFTNRRRVGSSKDTMNRLYVIENRYTLTGAMADHRMRIPASQIPAFAYALAGKIAAATKDLGLSSVIATLTQTPGGMQFNDAWITECANDLMSKPGASLIVAGSHQPVVVQLLAYAMNSALKNIGTTLLIREFPKNAKTNSILQLASEMNAGRIKQLFILGGDPVYNAYKAITLDKNTKAPVDWADLQKNVPDVIRVGMYEDSTSMLSRWHIPAAHYLESWSDALAADGSYVPVQPMIMPLYGGLSDIELLNDLLGNPRVDGPQLVQDTFRATAPPGDFDTAWSRFLRDGFAAHVQPKDKPPTFNGNAAGGVAHNLWSAVPAPKPDAPEIVLVRDYSVDDGRYANNSWLQELPDPITKLTWDNAAQIAPSYAKHLGVRNGELINIAITETMLDVHQKPIRRELAVAVIIVPGHAENSISIPLGYGRQIGTINAGLSSSGGGKEQQAASMETPGEPHGFDAYLLRTSSNPHFITADGKTVSKIQVTKVGRSYPLAITQEHWSIEGRGLVREATVEGYRKDPEFVKKVGGDEELPPRLPSIYSHPPLDAPQQWGMAVDLNVCTGCSACVIACQAENNVPVVGKLQVGHGRSMHWLRIDRYYASESNFNEDRGDYPEDPEMVHEPMMCQHCENAPCETVCPVNATVHSEDGLNVMVYNRCIGTRYCANNCPFKVRRFNFFDYNQRPIGKKKIAGSFGIYEEYIAPLTEKGAPDSIKMAHNPNVTVRMRGVMEKCTYCVQRVEEAKITAHARAGASSENLLIPRDSFTSACAQACPNEAIVFGDIKDPESKVSKIKAQDRNYRLLEYLNVNTRTSYLARIRNPNPKMPDAKKIGTASLEPEQPKRPGTGGKHDFHQHDKGVLNPHEKPEGNQAPQAKTGDRVPDQKP